jgi:hypothetical protein
MLLKSKANDQRVADTPKILSQLEQIKALQGQVQNKQAKNLQTTLTV